MPGSQQIIRADHGSVIENVTQIIQIGKEDVAFSMDSAKHVPNRVQEQIALTIVRKKVGDYFWKTPDIDKALEDVAITGYHVPMWRLHGEVSATWRVWKEKTIKLSDQDRLTQTIPIQKGIEKKLDWIMLANRKTNNTHHAISNAIKAFNRSQSPIRVDWQGYPCGEFLEKKIISLSAWFTGSPWKQKSLLANAPALFLEPKTDSTQMKIKISARSFRLPKLDSEMTLLPTIKHSNQQIKNHLETLVSKENKDVESIKVYSNVDYVEQYLFPLWVIEYTYRNTQYAAVINGYNAQLIDAMLPLTFRAKFIAWVVPTMFFTLIIWAYLFILFGLGGFRIFLLFFGFIPTILTVIFVIKWHIENRK